MEQVAIYCRLSDEDRHKRLETDESESIQNQKRMLVQYCEEQGWRDYRVYCDEDYSGIDRSRPDFCRMLEDCERGRVQIVLCKSQSRFSRDMEVIEKYLHNKFLEWRVRFVSLVDHVDTAQNGNKKSRQINGLINEWYLEDLSDNIRKTLWHKRAAGQFTGSFAPYGYAVDSNDKNHLVVDEGAAAVVRRIFALFQSGCGYRAIVTALNDAGIPNPSAYKRLQNSSYCNRNEQMGFAKGLWTHATVAAILRNETYTGCLVQGKTHAVSYKNKKRRKASPEDWVRVADTHEAIIDPPLWQAVQERLHTRERCGKTSTRLSPLSGMVRCGVCHAPMKRNVYYNKARTIAYYNLTCAAYKTGAMNCENVRALSGLQLETLLLSHINRLVREHCEVGALCAGAGQTMQTEALLKTRETLERQQSAKQDKLFACYEDKLDGVITAEQYACFRSRFEGELDALERQISDLTTRIETAQEHVPVLTTFPQWETLDRVVAQAFLQRVEVGAQAPDGKREITVFWNL